MHLRPDDRDRLPLSQLLVLKEGDLNIDGRAGFLVRRDIPVGEVMAHTGRHDVAGEVATTDLVKLPGDALQLTEGDQTVGIAATADGAHRTGLRKVEGLDESFRDSALRTSTEELLVGGVILLGGNYTAHDLTEESGPTGVEKIERGTRQTGRDIHVRDNLHLIPVR